MLPTAESFLLTWSYPHQREASQVEVMSRLRRILEEVAPDARIAVEYPSLVGGGQRNTDLQYVVKGPDVESLNRVAEQMVVGDEENTRFR